MQLCSLLEHVDARRVRGDVERPVAGVTRDTREVRPGWVFVAIRGATVDGHDLVDRVPEAAAVVVERPVQAPPGVTVVEVADGRHALALLAAGFHGRPGAVVPVIGITGTNGKTTVSTLVEQALMAAGHKAGRIGTTGMAVDGEPLPASLTTPEAPELQAALARMRDAGVRAVAMEVSSVGLVQRRVDGIPFHLGVFTNLSRDHLDFHGTMAAYRASKARLFTELLRPPGGPPRALLCADDPTDLGAPADRWTYGFAEGADLRIVDLTADARGLRLRVATPAGEGTLTSPLIGRYNAQNLVAALGCCLVLGLELPEALAALASARGAPGRMERIDNDRGLLVLVDYAHSPDALDNALRTVREVTAGRVWVVFGCGGGRDAGKRPEMGRAAQAADEVVVTSDNPRGEDPLRIIDDVLSGMDRAPHVEPDRREAIRYALARAEAGDTVLIAGKGHEETQEVAGVRHPFDDRRVARELL